VLTIAALGIILVVYCLIPREDELDPELLQHQLQLLHAEMIREDARTRSMLSWELRIEDARRQK
jgi:hypothetical protein